MDKEIQDMLNDLPNKKFSKLSDKRLEMIEKLKHKVFSESTREKISKSKKGKKFSKNHLEKISESLKGRINIQSNTKSIICFSYPNMDFIKEYESIRIACNELNLNYSSVWAVCDGNRKQTGGYTFRYKDSV